MSYESRVVVRGGIVVDKLSLESHVGVRGDKVVDRPSYESHVGVRSDMTLSSSTDLPSYKSHIDVQASEVVSSSMDLPMKATQVYEVVQPYDLIVVDRPIILSRDNTSLIKPLRTLICVGDQNKI